MVASINKSKKVVIIHDWLVGGGAEKVVEELHKLYPDAPIYTAYCNEEWQKRLDNKIITGYLQSWPFSKLRKYLPILMSNWFRSLNLEEFDTIIVSSGNGAANHIKKPTGSKMVFYCHTPTHYLWDKHKEYIENPGFGIFNPLVRFGLKAFLKPLKQRDLKGASQSDLIIANSTHTKQQIKKYYKKDSLVIFPPVDTKRFKSMKEVDRKGFVVVGRQVPYKKINIAVEACTELGLHLTVIGNGPENISLRSIAGPTVNFLTNASDQEVVKALQESEGFIFTSKEDFGIAPVEALAAGCPVIAYKAGGALDYVIPGKTGQFFESQTTKSLIKVLKNYKTKPVLKLPYNFEPGRFKTEFKKQLEIL
ncbi:glycosyltransferase [Candidatus Saccharibacteria bacterium]|nr:glycosyltransferase [Candidatus Saccharibacteria bacterium]